jgi:hypothetical protein
MKPANMTAAGSIRISVSDLIVMGGCRSQAWAELGEHVRWHKVVALGRFAHFNRDRNARS